MAHALLKLKIIVYKKSLTVKNFFVKHELIQV